MTRPTIRCFFPLLLIVACGEATIHEITPDAIAFEDRPAGDDPAGRLPGVVDPARTPEPVLGEVTLSFVAPEEGAMVMGQVAVVAVGQSAQGIASIEVVSPKGLDDKDPSPGRFAALWDTSLVDSGELVLLARAVDGLG